MERVCKVSGCDRPWIARRLCSLHYQRWMRLGTTEMERYGKVCSVEGCGEPHRTNGYCKRHAWNAWKNGEPGSVKPRVRVRRDRWVSQRDGYAYQRSEGHPRADKNGMVLEHVLVMEAILGRHLDWKSAGENVHHLNGVKDDNRPENLELWVKKQPPGQRVSDLVGWAYEIIERYSDLYERDDGCFNPSSRATSAPSVTG